MDSNSNKRNENVEEHVLETITVNKEIGKIEFNHFVIV